jgi:hypothetical protein
MFIVGVSGGLSLTFLEVPARFPGTEADRRDRLEGTRAPINSAAAG